MLPTTIIAIAVTIALCSVPVMSVFSQPYSTIPWILPGVIDAIPDETLNIKPDDLTDFSFNKTALRFDWNYNYGLAAGGCFNDVDDAPGQNNTRIEEQQEEERLIMTYTDLKNNTVKIYCQYNEWLGNDTRLRQFTAFYNDKLLVGLCPYDEAANKHAIYTNNDGEIERVSWLSVRTNGTDYVLYNTAVNNHHNHH